MQTRPQKRRVERHPTEIKCLACGANRVVFGINPGDTGRCPRCNYLGWDYSDELDGFTRRMVVSGDYHGSVVDRRTAPRKQTTNS
jgi:hypothetical protein